MSTSVENVEDLQLVGRARQGDRQAFAELWRRHVHAGLAVAHSYTSLDAEDLVSEAFEKIFAAIQAGRGPRSAFRPYLFTTIRNVAAATGRSRRELPLDTLDEVEDPNSLEQGAIDALDRSTTAKAFRSLPTRWQEVLWYSEVESLPPNEIAPLLGVSANTAAALAYRAREGLRQAWIRAHLQDSTDPVCAWTVGHLGSYARKALSRRDTDKIEKHLEQCSRCLIISEEAEEVNSRLRLILLPIAAGIPGAGAYLSHLQQGANALGAGAGVVPAALGAGGVSASSATSGAGHGLGSVLSSVRAAASRAGGASGGGSVGVFAIAAVSAVIALVPGVVSVATTAAPASAQSTQVDNGRVTAPVSAPTPSAMAAAITPTAATNPPLPTPAPTPVGPVTPRSTRTLVVPVAPAAPNVAAQPAAPVPVPLPAPVHSPVPAPSAVPHVASPSVSPSSSIPPNESPKPSETKPIKPESTAGVCIASAAAWETGRPIRRTDDGSWILVNPDGTTTPICLSLQ